MTATALFARDGDTWTPTELARGPWDPGACHGGPVAALVARLVEDADAGNVDWQVARLTVELVRPVPVGRGLSARTTIERSGRKVSLVAVTLHDGDVEVTRARALRIRRDDAALPAGTVQPPDDPPGSPGDVAPATVTWARGDDLAFHANACEHRFSEGSWDTPGPVSVWIRLKVPLVDGDELSGIQRVVAAADFGNGVSAGLPYEQYTFVNPDLTVHLLRPPVGEWIGMRTESLYGTAGVTSGVGMAESALYDTAGRLGRSVQSLFLSRR